MVVLVLFTAACAKPVTTIAPGGSMDVLGPVPALMPNPVPGDWITQGYPAPGQLTVVDLDGVPALKVVNGRTSLITVKPAQASLLATPYLSWAWNMDPQDDGPHQVRLLVGFHRSGPLHRPGRLGKHKILVVQNHRPVRPLSPGLAKR